MKIDWNEFGTDSVTFRTDPLNPNPFSEDDWQSWDIGEEFDFSILIFQQFYNCMKLLDDPKEIHKSTKIEY
jgi:hypothetical protein